MLPLTITVLNSSFVCSFTNFMSTFKAGNPEDTEDLIEMADAASEMRDGEKAANMANEQLALAMAAFGKNADGIATAFGKNDDGIAAATANTRTMLIGI